MCSSRRSSSVGAHLRSANKSSMGCVIRRALSRGGVGLHDLLGGTGKHPENVGIISRHRSIVGDMVGNYYRAWLGTREGTRSGDDD